jgi:hypothetical protein
VHRSCTGRASTTRDHDERPGRRNTKPQLRAHSLDYEGRVERAGPNLNPPFPQGSVGSNPAPGTAATEFLSACTARWQRRRTHHDRHHSGCPLAGGHARFVLGTAAHGSELGSASAVADSKQALLCTYLSAVLLAGLVVNSAVGWTWADPIAGLVIAAVALKEARSAWRGDVCCTPSESGSL